jgi:hypothetical protein
MTIRHLAACLADLDIETFCDKLLAMTPADHEDDIAMIALRTPPAR